MKTAGTTICLAPFFVHAINEIVGSYAWHKPVGTFYKNDIPRIIRNANVLPEEFLKALDPRNIYGAIITMIVSIN